MIKYCPACKIENRYNARFCRVCGQGLIEKEQHGTRAFALRPGCILNNRYSIQEFIKVGGMGAVYKAEDGEDERVCAIKELRPYWINSEQERRYLIKKFESEAKLLSRFNHINLPKVSDYFVVEDRYYLVMDFVDGQDLNALLKEKGNPGLPQEDVVAWGIEICGVLDYLHNNKPPVIYRDLKPSNIMIRTADKTIVLIDFGIACVVQDDMEESQRTKIGTVGYISPEQYLGKPVPASDIYSLGATLYHLVTGTKPLPYVEYNPVKNIIPHISESLEEVLCRALKVNLNQRYRKARDMKEDLENVINISEVISQSSVISDIESIPADELIDENIPGELDLNDNFSLKDDVFGEELPFQEGFFLENDRAFIEPGSFSMGEENSLEDFFDESFFDTEEPEEEIKGEKEVVDRGEVAWNYYKEAQSLISQENFEEAINLCEKALEFNEEFLEVYYTLGTIYKKVDRSHLAVESYKKYLALKQKKSSKKLKESKSLPVSMEPAEYKKLVKSVLKKVKRDKHKILSVPEPLEEPPGIKNKAIIRDIEPESPEPGNIESKIPELETELSHIQTDCGIERKEEFFDEDFEIDTSETEEEPPPEEETEEEPPPEEEAEEEPPPEEETEEEPPPEEETEEEPPPEEETEKEVKKEDFFDEDFEIDTSEAEKELTVEEERDEGVKKEEFFDEDFEIDTSEAEKEPRTEEEPVEVTEENSFIITSPESPEEELIEENNVTLFTTSNDGRDEEFYNNEEEEYREEKEPESIEKRLSRARDFSVKGQFTKALGAYKNVLNNNPDMVNIYINLAEVHKKAGEFQSAITNYEKYLSLCPDDINIHFEIGLLYRIVGNRKLAIKHFTRCGESDPTTGLAKRAKKYIFELREMEIPVAERDDYSMDNKFEDSSSSFEKAKKYISRLWPFKS